MPEFVLFSHTADAFVQLVRGIRDEQWNEPGLGEWDVRALVGHTSRALVTLLDYLALEEPKVVTIPNAERYYALATAEYGDPAGIVQRGVDAGASLGDDPVGTLRSLTEHALESLAKQSEDRIVAVRGGSILLKEYLRTRLMELVVHSIDIARATGQSVSFPLEAQRQTVLLAASIAAETGRGEELLLALTGRGTLSPGFSVV